MLANFWCAVQIETGPSSIEGVRSDPPECVCRRRGQGLPAALTTTPKFNSGVAGRSHRTPLSSSVSGPVRPAGGLPRVGPFGARWAPARSACFPAAVCRTHPTR